MKTSTVVKAVIGLAAGSLGTIHPAPGATAVDDGRPAIRGIQPQISPTTGAAPIRIYGSGFGGTTRVTFGGIPALDFKVIDGTLLTAVVPPPAGGGAANNTAVDIAVTDANGTAVSGEPSRQVFYTNATMTVTPDTDLDPGDAVVITGSGYRPNTGAAILQANPLLLVREDPDWGGSPPPYVTLADGGATTTPTGSFGPYPVTLQNPFTGSQPGYDPNNTCPVSQQAANYGLTKCLIIFTQFGIGSLERFISFTNDPIASAPSLALTPTTAALGSTVSLSGVRWNANPFFGSGAVKDDPGETKLLVELCQSDLSTCAPAASDAQVSLTRYFDANHATAGVQPLFTGAALSGTLTVDDASGCAPSCIVRVRQERYNYPAGGGTGSFVTASAPLTVTAALPSVSVGNRSVTEANTGVTAAKFKVTLSEASTNSVSVGYATADGSAGSGDYAATSGTLTFDPGQTVKTVTVGVNGDTVYETNERFSVNLSNPVNATIADGQGAGTIVNDDPAPTVSIADATVAEGDDGTRALRFTVSLSSVSERKATVQFSTSDDSAVTPGDYQAKSGTVTFAPGTTSTGVSVTVNGDVEPEPNETLFVTLSSPVNASLGDAQATGTIGDDD